MHRRTALDLPTDAQSMKGEGAKEPHKSETKFSGEASSEESGKKSVYDQNLKRRVKVEKEHS